MSLAIVHSRALIALDAPEVTVEVHLANGLPSFTLVGLADTEVKEARERVRAALINSGLEYPHNRRITVNLAPADLPKEGARFDLPIALGILAASEQIDPARLSALEFAGELSLGGDLRPVRGALAMALAIAKAGSSRRLVLPEASASEAALVPGLRPLAARHLLDVVAACQAHDEAKPLSEATARVAAAAPPVWDIRDVKGQVGAKRALEVAAAGGHSALLIGPPGTGKSMLAQRFTTLLPPLDEDRALASAAVLSLVGRFEPGQWRSRAFRSPHHSASATALVGGGSPPRPGEISLAHHGVLFLDELPEFPKAALEALREPLETGHITISRAAQQAEFPARFQLIAAMNPCPCGHAGSPHRACRCSPEAVARYQGKLSGPLLDRIDLQLEVPAMAPQALSELADGERSADVQARVAAAHAVQLARQGALNAELSGDALDRHCALDAPALSFLHAAASRFGWSGRSQHRVLRVARTVADLAHSPALGLAHLGEAIQYRRVLGVD